MPQGGWPWHAVPNGTGVELSGVELPPVAPWRDVHRDGLGCALVGNPVSRVCTPIGPFSVGISSAAGRSGVDHAGEP